ncbi:hypothetical protein AOL_s00097g329 [Orbilia oligospora ATCC 24927]|uniref:Uncharacterized protein n=1 Tax=Arthrobotrys oligospora (strain ATCC 24927 / CBS 115.81 / DSM 1491) TaxID=756982 RepID=G1XJ02_ARTOA|nr:hypothetical protein AOL_s00097g329 [Orbilia oligospora ATCC 24927]EGX46903.1 hypothetical protein AOL_s00097g329 [Orbilia oligospora ATCC 24927]
MSTPPRILTIAGSDSSGGAGIEADIKVITAHKCYGMTAMTGLTAQNTTGVVDIHPIPADFLRKVLSAVLEDVGVDVVKTGMLTSAQSISVIVESIKKYHLKTIVLDPVMISTSGSILLPTDAISNLCSNLIPLASLVTPNIPEAQHLLSYYTNPSMLPRTAFPIDNINSMADVVDLAKRLQEKCSTAVLVKGGHLPFLEDGSVARRQKSKAFVMDVLVLSNGTVKIFNSPFIESNNTHGTGCSLASAIACNIALSQPLPTAVSNARNYISGAIAASYPLGKGSGPINHVHNVYKLPYSKGHFIEYLINHPSVTNIWNDYVNHDFVKSIANGTISTEKFVWYLKQDYLFLVQFARAKALLTYKATTLAQINDCANYLTGVIRESALHVKYCAELIPGLTERDLQSTPEAPTTTAYTRYILDVGGNGDVAALMVSLISCSVGYQVAARNRENEELSVKTAQGNTFWRWVEEYASEEYAREVQTQRDILEEMAGGFGMTQVEELVEIFRKVTEMERNFFSAAVEAKFP